MEPLAPDTRLLALTEGARGIIVVFLRFFS